MKSTSRLLKKLKKAEQQRLAYHLESLGSAFCREYKIDPAQAVLVEKDGRYWYELRDPKELPETFRELFDIAVMLNNAVEAKDSEGEARCKEMLKTYLESVK